MCSQECQASTPCLGAALRRTECISLKVRLVGKTTLGLQFLMDGRAGREASTYAVGIEDRNFSVAASHGWSLEGIEIFELIPPELSLDQGRCRR